MHWLCLLCVCIFSRFLISSSSCMRQNGIKGKCLKKIKMKIYLRPPANSIFPDATSMQPYFLSLFSLLLKGDSLTMHITRLFHLLIHSFCFFLPFSNQLTGGKYKIDAKVNIRVKWIFKSVLVKIYQWHHNDILVHGRWNLI